MVETIEGNRSTSTRFMLTLEPGLRELADEFVSEFNERAFPAELTVTKLINTALRAYIADAMQRTEQTARVA